MHSTVPSHSPGGAVRRDDQWKEGEICHTQLLRLLPVAVYVCDADGLITFYNRAAAELWGREPVLHQDTWCGSFKILDRDGVPMRLDQCPMARTIREGRAIRGEQVIVERPDGQRFRVLPHPEPIWNAEGKVVGAVNTLVKLET